MRVVIALASSSGQISGVSRHGINLAASLLMRIEIREVHLVVAPWQLEFVQDAAPCNDPRFRLHIAPIGNSALSRNRWFYSKLPKLAAELSADIVHLAYPVPLQRGVFHCPVVVTLHDLYPYDIPENFGFPKVIFNRAALKQCLRRSDAIACVSQSTFSRLKSLDSRLASKAVVIYNSVEPKLQQTTKAPMPDWEGVPFLLCVAQHRRNKNIPMMLRVFERLLQTGQLPLGARLLIVGITGPESTAIKDRIAILGLAGRVILLNGISDTQLQWCYRNCSLVVASSILEGFGLPVAEALLSGCRVVCSDIPAFRELGEARCTFVPLGPGEVVAFANAICAALRQKRPEPISLPQLSPRIVAEAYMHLYLSLVLAPAKNKNLTVTPLRTTGERRSLL